MFRRRLPQRSVPLPPYDAPTERTGLRLAVLDQDYWQLRDGEHSAREHPDTFDVPPREVRDNLRRLDLVKLIFDIEGQGENDEVEVRGERMWVLVAERVPPYYIGILVNEPDLVDPSSNFYLRPGCEVLFAPEHVVSVEAVEAVKKATERLEAEPTLRWPYRE